jgi:dihydrofolate reductase
MGLIHIELFATLDLVGQAPGGPDEDPAGFPFGGWQAPLLDEVAGAQVGAAYEGTDALLLGRRTYDVFAAHWPYQEGGEDGGIAALFNGVPKYVASRGRPDLSWAGSTQVGPDLAGAVREIRDRHEHVKVVGSLGLVQTLLREKLFDRLDLWVHPVVLGVGKKVFGGGAVPTNLTPPRTARGHPDGHRAPALRVGRWHARDRGHERAPSRCPAPGLTAPSDRVVDPIGAAGHREPVRSGPVRSGPAGVHGHRASARTGARAAVARPVGDGPSRRCPSPTS